MMGKHYANLSFMYAIIAMIAGVFYREYTKFNHFSGQTNLSVMHTHYFLLGMLFFLVLMLAEKVLSFSDKNTKKIVVIYQIGLNITGLGFLLRGLTQVWGTQLSTAMDASISGIAGIGHITIGVCILLFLVKIKRQA